MSLKLASESIRVAHATLAVVLQVRDGGLRALLWRRGREPHAGAWALPGGTLGARDGLAESILHHLAAKVDLREVAHLEQLATYGQPDRNPVERELVTAYLGLVPAGVDPRVPDDTSWHSVDELPQMAFDHRSIALAGRTRLRAKLSYSNVAFALAPASFTLAELREIYVAALGHEVSVTNLRRVLLRRDVIVQTGGRRSSGRAGGRPADEFRFRTRRLEITDPFAALRPPP